MSEQPTGHQFTKFGKFSSTLLADFHSLVGDVLLHCLHYQCLVKYKQVNRAHLLPFINSHHATAFRYMKSSGQC